MTFLQSDQTFYTINFIFANGFLSSRDSAQLPHLVEHLIMDSDEIREIKKTSALVNAHTTDLKIVFEMTCLPENSAKNADLFLRAFENVKINNFAKNLEIVRNELATVSPRRALLEDAFHEISPDNFANHSEHISSLDKITPAKAEEFWRENFAKSQMRILYSGSEKIDILENSESKKDAFLLQNIDFIKNEVEVSRKNNNHISSATKLVKVHADLGDFREKILLNFVFKVCLEKLRNDLRAAGLIYAIWGSVFASLSSRNAVLEFHFNAQDDKIEQIFSQINTKDFFENIINLTEEEFAVIREKYVLNFAKNQQTEEQKTSFINAQLFSHSKFKSVREIMEIVREISLYEFQEFAKIYIK